MILNKPTLLVASLLLALGLNACDKPGPAEEAGKKLDQIVDDTGKKVGDTVDKIEKKMDEQGDKTAMAIDDTEITARVKAAILAEAGLKSLQISVDTVRGVVTLTGSVDSQGNSDKAGSLAGAVKDVSEVRNQLVVTPYK